MSKYSIVLKLMIKPYLNTFYVKKLKDLKVGLTTMYYLDKFSYISDIEIYKNGRFKKKFCLFAKDEYKKLLKWLNIKEFENGEH